MERLGHMIEKEIQAKKWKGIKMGRNGLVITHLFFADDLILFGEASENQLQLMGETMKKFCDLSGHRINLAKSKAFFSRNVHITKALSLSQQVGIGITTDLGKYLGVPLLHTKITKLMYFPLLQKVQSRLSSWKGKFLTMAGRTVLIKAVLSAIPGYQMQTTLLHKGVLKDLEKYSRQFLWNQSQEGRKMHLISWDQIKKAKLEGGLGIKDLRHQNMAYIMKLCWNLLTKSEALWVKCLRSKYGCGEGHQLAVCKKRNSSATWQSIVAVWDKFQQGVGMTVKDGRQTSFWWDVWTPLNEPFD